MLRCRDEHASPRILTSHRCHCHGLRLRRSRHRRRRSGRPSDGRRIRGRRIARGSTRKWRCRDLHGRAQSGYRRDPDGHGWTGRFRGSVRSGRARRNLQSFLLPGNPQRKAVLHVAERTVRRRLRLGLRCAGAMRLRLRLPSGPGSVPAVSGRKLRRIPDAMRSELLFHRVRRLPGS